MTAAVREALSELAAEVSEAAGVDRESILEVTLVGNPIMHHLVLGIDPVELGGAPFALAIDRAVTVTAAELGVALHPNARVYALPCIAGQVGADTAGVILAERPDLLDEMTLLVDVGTNAEIVPREQQAAGRLLEPHGPRVRRRTDQLAASAPRRARSSASASIATHWSHASRSSARISGPMSQALPRPPPRQGVTGICGSGIIEVLAELYLAGIITQDGVIDGSMAARTPRVVANGRTWSYVLYEGAQTLSVLQNDVRAIQLGKAALLAGIRLLMERLDIESVDRIRLAGAFGAHIDVKYAKVLGIDPDCDLTKVTSAGNAAGTGARIALLDSRSRPTIEGARASRREDRNGHRAAIPGTLRRGHVDSAQDRRLPEPAQGRRPAAA
jgi:uncharacterized 2Fe-2S/4Fe-4S cluster protein (DUF4445 family)